MTWQVLLLFAASSLICGSVGGLIAKHKGRDYLRWVLRGALGGAIVMFVILAIFVLIAIYALGQVKWD